MCANLALNSLPNVFAYQKALGSAPGSIQVPCLDVEKKLNWGGVSLVDCQESTAWGDVSNQDVKSVETVPLVTIDSLALKACRFIKADVEGMELDVILGAQETIKRCRPLLYLEYENGTKERDQKLIDLLIASINVFCVPREQAIKVVDMKEL